MNRSNHNNVYGLFNDSFPPVLDGVTLTVVNYVNWLADHDRRVTVVTPWCAHTPAHPDYDMHRYFSLPIYNRHPYRYGYPLLDPFIWLNLRRLPLKLAHAHCPFSSGRLAAYAARKHRVPLIATFHSKYLPDLRRSLPPFMVDYQMRRMRRFYDSADAVWIPQAAVEETVREYGITAPVTVVENGNDLADDAFTGAALTRHKADARRRLNIPPDRTVLLFVGRHIAHKGVDIIIDALTQLNATDWEMHFVGTGYYADQMRQNVTARGLSPRVTFHGNIADRSYLSDLYAAASLFLFPSLYDNAPLVVREAAAMGTPSILPLGSTAAEPVTNDHNGFLTDCSAEAYACLIDSLTRRPDIISRVGLQARQSLARSWASVMEEVDCRYNEIIARHSHAR